MESNILFEAVLILAGAGAFGAFMGWLKRNEAFEAKKFVLGVVTGIFAGIALTIANAAGILNAVDQTAQFILIGTLALAVIGVDNLRTATSGAINVRAEEKAEDKTA